METGDRRRWIDRREFLRCSALTGIGLGLLPLDARAAAEPPRVKRRVRLGRTGLQPRRHWDGRCAASANRC
jgi:hypothetical protein